MPIDLSNAWKSGARIINYAISLLPNIILAAGIFILFLIVASAAKSIVRRITQRRGVVKAWACFSARLHTSR
jgi:hypothetical protein